MLAHVTLHKNSVLDRLQALGVKIAIDDFGTQYSSLDYLKTYRVSRVKIPRPMLDDAMQDPGLRPWCGQSLELHASSASRLLHKASKQRRSATC